MPLIVPFQGTHEGQRKLYVLLSFDAVRGNVLHLSTNFTPLSTGASLRYRWRGTPETQGAAGDIVQRVSQTEAGFLQRSQFDEIQYGSAAVKFPRQYSASGYRRARPLQAAQPSVS